jgi:hypothetical protein
LIRESAARQNAALRLGVELISPLVHDTTELEMAITAQSREPGSALLLLPDGFTATHRDLIIQLAVATACRRSTHFASSRRAAASYRTALIPTSHLGKSQHM